MKARIAKKLLKMFIQQQALLVPPCCVLVIKSNEIDVESMMQIRKVLDARKVDIKVVLVLPESAQIEVVSSSTSGACPPASSAPPPATDNPSK